MCLDSRRLICGGGVGGGLQSTAAVIIIIITPLILHFVLRRLLILVWNNHYRDFFFKFIDKFRRFIDNNVNHTENSPAVRKAKSFFLSKSDTRRGVTQSK